MQSNARTFAIGNDLVALDGFGASCDDLFIRKVYTENEIAYCERFADSMVRYASTWAAKEAVYKAVKQLDDRPVGWKQIEITRQKIAGEPRVILHKHGDRFEVSLTITHDGGLVWAAAMITSR